MIDQETHSLEEPSDWEEYRIARISDRVKAYLIDMVMISGIGTILGAVTGGILLEIPLFAMHLMTIGVVGAIYFSVLTKIWGQTIGKMMVGIRVVQETATPLTWKTVFLREVVGRTVAQFLGTHFGYMWGVIHKKNQGWHDILIDTYVVEDPEIQSHRMLRIPKQ